MKSYLTWPQLVQGDDDGDGRQDLLALWRDSERHSAQVKALAANHVAEIDRKIVGLRGMRDTLTHLMERCHGDDRPECPILDALGTDA